MAFTAHPGDDEAGFQDIEHFAPLLADRALSVPEVVLQVLDQLEARARELGQAWAAAASAVDGAAAVQFIADRSYALAMDTRTKWPQTVTVELAGTAGRHALDLLFDARPGLRDSLANLPPAGPPDARH